MKEEVDIPLIKCKYPLGLLQLRIKGINISGLCNCGIDFNLIRASSRLLILTKTWNFHTQKNVRFRCHNIAHPALLFVLLFSDIKTST